MRKTFTIQPGSYVIGVTVSVEHGERRLTPTIHWGPALGDVKAVANQYMQLPQGILFRDGEIVRLSASTITSQPIQEGSFQFAGVDDHYFMTAALDPGAARVEFAHRPLPSPQSSTPVELVAYAVRYQRTPTAARFFVGPKDFDVLASVDRDLVRAINFGWFSWLVVPLLRSLKWVHGYVGNYGWAIIILTILINAVMFPLRHKSVVSMRRMQELQPEVKAIQDRYGSLKATDPARQKMNVELMNLYRERGVNPASGCIPMLLTMPVLFAFYSLLSVAIEIRGAPFVGWIRDLSVYDPMYVTPILMGITMVVQQKMTPTTADPVQQKMMMAMPVVFTFMFLWAPSGLVLYWLVSNVWAIGQQHITNRIIGPPVVRTVRPAAERRAKTRGRWQNRGSEGCLSPSTRSPIFSSERRARSGCHSRRRWSHSTTAGGSICRGKAATPLLRRRGEALTALQHIVEAAYRRQLGGKRLHLDCLGFRKDKEAELRQMAKYLAGRAKETGVDQQIGPLNPYDRRLVHLEIAEDSGVTSESIGDAHMKTVIISAQKP